MRGSEKSGTKKSHSGKKTRPDLLVRSKLILSLIAYGYSAIEIRKQMNRQYEVSKQLLSEDLRRMIINKWIIDENPGLNKYKYYKMTESGRTVLAGYDNSDLATLVKIENNRHRTVIRNPAYLKRFLSMERYLFEPRRTLNNVMTYYGKVEGVTIQVNMGKEISMIMTPAPIYTTKAKKGRVRTQQTLLDVINKLNREWLLDLTPPVEVSGHGQIALGGELPKNLLKKNGGGQIRIHKDYGVVTLDASPPDKLPQLEFPSNVPDKVDDLLDMPDQMKKVMERLDRMENRNQVRDDVLDRLSLTIEKNGNALERLADLISGKVNSGQDQVKTDLSRDAYRMFG